MRPTDSALKVNDHDTAIREFLDAFRALTVQSMTSKGYARYRKQQIHFIDSSNRIQIYSGKWRFARNHEINSGGDVVYDSAGEGVEILAPMLVGKTVDSIELNSRWRDLIIRFSCGATLEVQAPFKISALPVWRLVSGRKTLLLGVSNEDYLLAGNTLRESTE